MNSSSNGLIMHFISPDAIQRSLAAKSIAVDEKTKQKIVDAFKPNNPAGKINVLINKLNNAKQAYQLYPGLTKKQRDELSLLIKLEKEFKERHQQKIATHEDYKKFIEVQHNILPLQQMMTWWNANHIAFMDDDFWKKLSNAAKTQSKKNKEAEKQKRKRLHKLVDIKEDYNNYQPYYALSSDDLLTFYHDNILPLEEAVKNLFIHHSKEKKPYHAVFANYLVSVQQAIEAEKKLILYSMLYRLKCTAHYKSNDCDDLMAYTCDRVYYHANIKQQDHKIIPAKRKGLSPDLIKQFYKLIEDYAKQHPEDTLLKNKSTQIRKKPAQTAAQEKPTENKLITSTQHHAELGHLILSIEDIITTINSDDPITIGNITAFLTHFERTVLSTTDQLLLTNASAFDFKTLLICNNALYNCLCPRIKSLVLAANKDQLDTNPNWYHLANHLGSRRSMHDLATTLSEQNTTPEFQQIMRFSTHFSEVKHKLNTSIKSSLLKEAHISITPDNHLSFPLHLQTQPLSNQQLLDLWTVCAKKLKTNHITTSYDPIYALKMTKYLTHISDQAFLKSQEDDAFREKFIKLLFIINTIKTDMTNCLRQQARSTRFHYLFSGQMNADAVLKPVISVINKILALELNHKLDSYIKNYADDHSKLSILTALRTKLNAITEEGHSAESLPEAIDVIIKTATLDNKLANAHRFNRSLQSFAKLSKQYFEIGNEQASINSRNVI